MSLDLSGGQTIYHTRKRNQKRIPASALRLFERGSRNCTGQELANIEARIVLACVVRRYTWEKVGLGATKLDGDQCPVLGVDRRYVATEGVFNVGFSSFSLLYVGLLGCGAWLL
jgi:hypothetical protein